MTVIPIAPRETHAQTALAAAQRLTGEPATSNRTMLVAYAAMRHAFPAVRHGKISAELLGYEDHAAAVMRLRKAREVAAWWREEWVDEVVGALVADRYEERAL